MTDTNTLQERIINNAKQCVKCGLCAPHCPTYSLTLNENESSRGRITLADSLAKEEITLTNKTRLYLDHCLTCRACEAACPSEVKYGEIIDDVRQLMAATSTPSSLLKQMGWIMRRPWRIQCLQISLFVLQKTGVLWLSKKLGIGKLLGRQRLMEILPTLTLPMSKHINQHLPASGYRGRIGLFLGCISQWSEKPVYLASVSLLNALGYEVVIPKKQTCCGAIWQHAGLHDDFRQQQQRNHTAFGDQNIDAVISIASGCSAALLDYQPPLAKVWEITDFLAQELEKNTLTFKPLDKHIAIHIPCSQRNVLRAANATENCLRRIPDIKLSALTDSAHCCGAAGLNMLEHPETADPLATKALANLEQLKPDLICTTNIGCQLHFQRKLRKDGKQVGLCHPVVVLAQQLQRD